MDSFQSNLYKFIGGLLRPDDFDRFRMEFDRNSFEVEHSQMVEISNEFEFLEKVYNGKKPNYRHVPPSKDRTVDIVVSALRKAGEEKVKEAWFANMPSAVIIAYPYKLHEYQIKNFILGVFKPIEFISRCCLAAFPSATVFKLSNQINIEKSIQGVGPETNAKFESREIFCNEIKFNIFIIEYFPTAPADAYKYIIKGDEVFSLDNHPFNDIKQEIINNNEKKNNLDPFWIVFFVFVVFALFVGFSAKR